MTNTPPPARRLQLENKHVFISYSRKDGEFVDRFTQDLYKAGVRFWRDEEHLDRLLPSWARQIPAAIQRSYVLVLVASPDCAESEVVSEEVLMAKSENVPILAVWARGDMWIKCVPFGMGIGLQYYEDLRPDKYDLGCARTIAILKGEDVPGSPFTPISSDKTSVSREVNVESAPSLRNRMKTTPLKTTPLHKPTDAPAPIVQVIGGRFQRETTVTLDIVMSGKKFIIGRDDDADLVVHSLETSVSRVHAAIFMKEGRCYISDSSSNGTTVRGERIPQHDPIPLENGDEIVLSEAVKMIFWLQEG